MNLALRLYGRYPFAVLMSICLSACLAPESTAPVVPAAASAPLAVEEEGGAADESHAHVLGRPPRFVSGVVSDAPAAPPARAPQGQNGSQERVGDDTAGRCDESRLYAAGGNARAVLAELELSRPECFEDVFKGRPQSRAVLAPDIMRAVAHEARRRAERWDGGYDPALASMAAFIKAGYLVTKERRRGVAEGYGRDIDRAVVDASRALLEHPALWRPEAPFKERDFNNWRMAAYFMVRDMSLLLDSVREEATIRPAAEAFLARYAAAPAIGQASLARYAVYSVLAAVAHQPLSPDFKSRLEHGEFDGLSAALNRLTGAGERYFEGGEIYRFAVRQAGYFLRFERTRDAALQAVAPLLESQPRLSPNWSHAAYTMNKARFDCRRYKFCRYEEELREKLFPQSWRFDRGERVFQSSLTRTQAEELYHASKQVEAQFQRVTGAVEPVARDPNRKLTLVIYPSRQAYRDYQVILNELSVDNGGIYIESLGKLFTFQRSREDSWLTLEELVRHEYTHYLAGRYLRAGLYGEGALDDRADRMPWFDEGLAEFLTGATRERVEVRANMVNGVAEEWPRRHRTPDYLMDFAYSDGWKHYQYAALWFNFLQQEAPEALAGVLAAVRGSDAVAFDRWVEQQGTLQAAPYRNFVGEQVRRLRSGELGDAGMRHGTDWLDAEAWQETEASALERHFPAALAMRCRTSDNGSESVLARFACDGRLPAAAGGGAGTRQAVSDAINRWTGGLARQRNNFLAMTCAPGDSDDRIRCEGPLRRSHAAMAAPMASSARASVERLRSPGRCLNGTLLPGTRLLSAPSLGRLRVDSSGEFFYYRDRGRSGQADRIRISEPLPGGWHERELELDAAAVDLPDAECWRLARG